MTEAEIYQRMLENFHEVFDDDDIVISPETMANDIDGWDSLAHIRLIVSLEKEFGVSFSAAEASSFQNVAEVVSCIVEKDGT